MKLGLIFILLISQTVLAQGKPKVLVLDPDMDSKELDSTFEVQRPSDFTALPKKEDRDLLFEGNKKIAKFDELKKDILYVDLRTKSVEEVKKKYPELNEQEIKFLKGKF